MNEDFELVNDSPCCMTADTVDFWFDGPGDATVRPCRPEHLEHAMAERAKIQAALAARQQANGSSEDAPSN